MYNKVEERTMALHTNLIKSPTDRRDITKMPQKCAVAKSGAPKTETGRTVARNFI